MYAVVITTESSSLATSAFMLIAVKRMLARDCCGYLKVSGILLLVIFRGCTVLLLLIPFRIGVQSLLYIYIFFKFLILYSTCCCKTF